MSYDVPIAISNPSQDSSPDSAAAPVTYADAIPPVNGLVELMSEGPASFSSSHSSLQLQLQLQPEQGSRTPAEDGNEPVTAPGVDPLIIEALKSKDRLFVLKVGEQMEALLRDQPSRTYFDLAPETSYQRLLVHRCAEYYNFTPVTEQSTRCISLVIAPGSAIPIRRISELVPPEETALPKFKIMRRSEQDRRRTKVYSQPGSVAGEDGEQSDPEPSESGSMGSRSTTSKKHMSIKEREAAYQEARSRIFMDFEEKERAKERDTSASSSSRSLASAPSSTNGGGGCAVDEADETASSSAATESEWSGPTNGDRRRGGGSVASLSRPFRPASSTYNGQGVNGRSGSASPALAYPTLYDHSTPSTSYEQPQGYVHPPMGAGGYAAAPYPVYSYPHPGQAPGQAYIPPYPYYPPYPYPMHHPHFQATSDPASPVASPVDGYPHPAYAQPYMWPPPPVHPQYPGAAQPPPDGPPPPPQHIRPVQHHQSQNSNADTPPTIYQPQPFPSFISNAPYVPTQAGPYAPHIPPYFHAPTAPPTVPPGPHMRPQPIYPLEIPPSGTVSEPSVSSSSNGGHSPTFSRNGHNHFNGNRRGAPPARATWSYGPGPGVGSGGMTHPVASGSGFGQGGGEIVGPRLSNFRKISGNSSTGSGGSGGRTPADETASTASSSNGSTSSKRTYMSTPPKHPLPPRPDWAAGMKAQPTLHAARNRAHDSPNSSRNSPNRHPVHLGQGQQLSPSQPTPVFLQSTDFPPLPISSPVDRRPAVGAIGGVWTNPNSARTILAPNPNHTNQVQGSTYGNALFKHGVTNGSNPTSPPNRLEDDERGFERPPPKVNAELFNPKGVMINAGSASSRERGEKERAQAIASAILVDKVSSLNLQGQEPSTASPIDAKLDVLDRPLAHGVDGARSFTALTSAGPTCYPAAIDGTASANGDGAAVDGADDSVPAQFSPS